MQVTPADIRSLALETLTVGVNYAATDFSLLDPDILGLFFVQGYETPPEELIKKNWEANQRSWYINQASPFATEPSKDRSGGAKFGIAFAILLLIALAALIAVYLYKNRAKLLGDKDEEWTSCCCCPMGNSPPKRSSPRKSSKKGSKKSRRSERYAEEEEDDIALYKRQQRRALGLEDDEDDDDLDEISFTETQATFRTVSSSPRSTRTRPVSSEVVTPRSNAYDQHDFRRTTTTRAPSYLETERNIVTPVSDWRGRSTYSRDGDFSDAPNAFAATPDDRIRVSLSKDTIRNSSARKNRSSAAAPLDEFSFSTRRYDVDDTVDL